MSFSRKRSATFTLLLLACLLTAACSSAYAAGRPELVVISPGLSPTIPGKVAIKANLKTPRGAKIKRARFYLNGKLVTTDSRGPFAIRKGVKFDTRRLPSKKPYLNFLVKYEQVRPNRKTATKSLKKRIRVSFIAGDVGAKGDPLPPWTGYRLALDEEFSGDSLDTSLWNTQRYDSIDEEVPGTPAMSRPFNGDEGAAYSPENVSVRDGTLNLGLSDIPASDPSGAGYSRSTGMVNTRGKFAFKYGYVETRAWVPEQLGSWPTFWMVPSESDDQPPEIDIFEFVYITEYRARFPHTVFHWKPDGSEGDDQFQHCDSSEPSPCNGNVSSPRPQEWFTSRPAGDTYDLNYMGQWHTYGLLWQPDHADVYVDGKYRLSVHGASKLPQQSMYLIYQMAIMKASLGRGIPEAGSAMKIDYLRVYSNNT